MNMFKRSIVLGTVSGLLAGLAAVIYQKVYTASLGTDFTSLVKPLNLVAIGLLSGLIAATAFWLLQFWWKERGEIVFNLAFVLVSFASIVTAFSAKLPVDVDMPELFPGLVVPMHFFPALAWFTLRPIFFKESTRLAVPANTTM